MADRQRMAGASLLVPVAERPATFRLRTLGGLALEDGNGHVHPDLPPGGRVLALLAYLALARRTVTRDQLATLLWGAREERLARQSLRSALSQLRRALGAAAIARRSEAVALTDVATLRVDAVELAAAAHAGQSARVVALYVGPFLDGVHTGDGNALEDWVAATRAECLAHFQRASACECDRLAGDDDWEGCAALAKRWVDAAPLDADAALARLRALAAPDSRDSLRRAIDEGDRLTLRLAREYALPADPSVARAIARFERRLASLRGAPDAPDPPDASGAASVVVGGGAVPTIAATPVVAGARSPAGARSSAGGPGAAPRMPARPDALTLVLVSVLLLVVLALATA